MSELRTVEFRLAPASDLAKRCDEANKILLKAQWEIEDIYNQTDADEAVIDVGRLSDWKAHMRTANAALVLAAAALGQVG